MILKMKVNLEDFEPISEDAQFVFDKLADYDALIEADDWLEETADYDEEAPTEEQFDKYLQYDFFGQLQEYFLDDDETCEKASRFPNLFKLYTDLSTEA